MISISNQKQNYIFFFFLLASVALRFFSFFPSVMDHDESTYLIIGRDILNGKMLYTDVTDTKPVGIFLFYAGLEFLFGSSIFWKRLVFALFVGATSFLIFKASKKLFSNNKVAFASGVIYLFYTSIWNYHGRSPNTELLFNFCTIAGLLFFLNKNAKSYFAGGLALGIGFIIKYLVLFDLIAILLFFFIVEMNTIKAKSFWNIFGRYVLAGVAFSIPFGLVNLYFWLGNHFNDFYFITYELPGNYGGSPSLSRYFIMLADFTGKFLPISILVFYVIFKKNKPIEKQYKWFFTLWIASVLFAIYIPGKEFSHYTIQLMLPLSLLAGIFFHPDFGANRILSRIYSKKTGLIILSVIILTVQSIAFKDEFLQPDLPREVAEYISKEKKSGDRVFVSNYQQIVYYLLKIDSPTKFIHSNLLFTNTHKVFNINAEDEIKRIMDTKPEFVIVQRNNKIVEKLLRNKYKAVKDFQNKNIVIYR